MQVIDAFWAATETAAHRHPHWADPALLPTRLAWAAASVLRSDGAGLNLSTGAGFRVRLGSSNEIAALAEQLEFTTGQGPFLEADEQRKTITSTETVMLQTWPVFARQLLTQTPFRSIYATPVPGIGTLDIYSTSPTGNLALSVSDALLIAQQISQALTDPEQYPAIEQEIRTGFAGGRHQVNVAIGLISQAKGVSIPDALAALRVHSFANDTTLDDLASALADGYISVTPLMP